MYLWVYWESFSDGEDEAAKCRRKPVVIMYKMWPEIVYLCLLAFFFASLLLLLFYVYFCDIENAVHTSLGHLNLTGR